MKPNHLLSSSNPPAYNKPKAPGIYIGFDNVISLYHIVEAGDDFDTTAQHVFALLKEAQERYPDWPRVLYLDIIGHEGDRAGYDGNLFEFQQEFMVGVMGVFFTALDMPLLSVYNPKPQRNDMPDVLRIGLSE